MVEGLLIGRIGLLKVIHHQVAVSLATNQSSAPHRRANARRTKTAPDFSVITIQLQYLSQELDGSREVLFRPQNERYRIHRLNGVLVVAQRLFIRSHSAVKVTHQLGQAS